MTNDELFEDLKQFINAKVDGVESRLESSLGGRLDKVESRLDGVESGVNELKEGLDEANLKLDTVIEATGERLGALEANDKKQDKRLAKLELDLAA